MKHFSKSKLFEAYYSSICSDVALLCDFLVRNYRSFDISEDDPTLVLIKGFRFRIKRNLKYLVPWLLGLLSARPKFYTAALDLSDLCPLFYANLLTFNYFLNEPED